MTSEPLNTIVIGSFNREKAAEMAELLKDLRMSMKALNGFPRIRPVPETSRTFAENARIKALGIARQLNAATHGRAPLLGVVADDSGLEVDALNGRPGVMSARYISETATDPERVRRLLLELGDLPPARRTARFRCHIAFAEGERVLLEAEGVVEGAIGFQAVGSFGFGYDPIFIPQGYDNTFAELGPDVKHRISHRAEALRSFRDKLLSMLKED